MYTNVIDCFERLSFQRSFILTRVSFHCKLSRRSHFCSTREFTHPNHNDNDNLRIHEITERPRAENMIPGTCILRTTGFRGFQIWRENSYFILDCRTFRFRRKFFRILLAHLYNQVWLIDEILEIFSI